jgi:hypothetical protein
MDMSNPVKTEGRICFGLEWYATEAEAEVRTKEVRESGQRYNGGFYHGSACGREKGFDYVDKEHGPLFAVVA